MAELLLKVRDGAGYQDGDIICAFSRRNIQATHAHLQCHQRDPKTRRLLALEDNGLILPTDVLWDYCEATREYRFEQLSRTEGRITRLSDGQEIRFETNKPFEGFNGRMQAMDIEAYVKARRRTLHKPNAQGFPMFDGVDGVTWHGGKTDVSTPVVEKVWTAIEKKMPLTRTMPQFMHAPLGRQDIRSHLPIATQDFNDTDAATLVASEIDDTDPENIVVIQKRVHSVKWRNRLVDLGDTEANVLDKARAVDRRAVMVKRNYKAIIHAKSARILNVNRH